MANRWALRGNFTWSENDLKVGDDFLRHDDPTDVIFTGTGTGGYGDDGDIFTQQSSYRAKRGIVLNNRWSFNVNGVYQIAPDKPWGFDVAGNITGREGYPSPPFVGSNSFQVQLTEDLDAFRSDDVITVDARIAKEVAFGDFGVTFSLDAFNLLDEQTVLQRNRTAPSDSADLPDSYQVLERLSPRVFRWGLTFRYR
jgi:hypothetical protein